MFPKSLRTLTLLILGIIAVDTRINVLMVPHLGKISHEEVFYDIGFQLVSIGYRVDILKTAHKDGKQTLHLQTITNSTEIERGGVKYKSAITHSLLDDHQYERVCGPMEDLIDWKNEVYEYYSQYCRFVIGNRQLLGKLRRNHYRVVLVDVLCNECAIMLSELLPARLLGLWLTPFAGKQGHIESVLGTNTAVAMRQQLSRPQLGGWDIHQLVISTLTSLVSFASFHFHQIRLQHIIKQHKPNIDYERALQSLDVTLLNANFLVTKPLPLPPNVQHAGCLQCHSGSQLNPQIYTVSEFGQGLGESGALFLLTGHNLWTKPSVVRIICRTARIFKNITFVAVYHGREPVCPGNGSSQCPVRFVRLRLAGVNAFLGSNRTMVHIHAGSIGDIMMSSSQGVPSVALVSDEDEVESCYHTQQYGHVTCHQTTGLTRAGLTRSLIQLTYNSSFREAAGYTRLLWKQQRTESLRELDRWLLRKNRFGTFHYLKTIDRQLNLAQYLMLDVMVFLGGAAGVLFVVTLQLGVTIVPFFVRTFRLKKVNSAAK